MGNKYIRIHIKVAECPKNMKILNQTNKYNFSTFMFTELKQLYFSD